MQYYDHDSDKKRRRIIGLMAVTVYFVVFFAVALLVGFTTEKSKPVDYGMLIDFGVTESGSGDEEVAMSDGMAIPQIPGSNPDDTIVTQDTDDDAPVIEQPSEERDNTRVQTARNNVASTENTEVRQVNPEALFPGRGSGDSRSDGTGDTPGNQGHPSGGAGGSRDGTGTGDSGVAYSLEGRKPIGSLATPRYEANVQGRVVIEVIVDEHGKVTSAVFRGQGSTTQDSELVKAAVEAARKSNFTEIPGADPQKGTLTYTFRLK